MSEYIDFHAHILPGADHGSDGLDTSLWQLKSAEKAGVGTIVFTPHFYPDVSDTNSFFERRDEAFKKLKETYMGEIKFCLGAEVFLCDGLQNLPRLDELCISGTKRLLIEMPNPPWNYRFERALMDICSDGYQITLAHIERYPDKAIDKLLMQGINAQINAEILLKPLKRRRYIKLIETGIVTAIGSDIHGKSEEYKIFSNAMKALGAKADILMESMRDSLNTGG